MLIVDAESPGHPSVTSCRRHRTLLLCLFVYPFVCTYVSLFVLAPYTSEEDDDDVNPREKKQVGHHDDADSNDVIYFRATVD